MGAEKRNILNSLNSSVDGFIYALRTQRNMRVQFLVGVFVVLLGIYMDLGKIDLCFLIGAISLVLICEMINTCVRSTIDMMKDTFHPMARIVKDVSAGSVFIAIMNAIVVGYIILSRNIAIRIEDGIYRIKQSPWHVTFISMIIVLIMVLIGKVIFKRGTPFRGGMPSGHSAFAFAIWTAVSFFSREGLIVVLTFALAFMIARNRVMTKIHSLWEVVAGSLLGMLATALVFQVLR